MPHASCITLRQHLQGQLTDFIKKSKVNDRLDFVDIACEAVSIIYDYKEEGTTLFLDLYITDNIDIVMKMLPDGKKIEVGGVTAEEAKVKEAIKKVAPLARNGWKIYFQFNKELIKYGVFRDSGNPIAPPIEYLLINSKQINQTPGQPKQSSAEKILKTQNKDLHILRVAKIHHNTVTVSTHDGLTANVIFNYISHLGYSSANSEIEKLSQYICKKLENETGHYEKCFTYAKVLLTKSLRESHGALVAVVNSLPKCLKDGIVLEKPISISDEIRGVSEDLTKRDLDHYSDIIAGMFSCDGIVVFDQSFSVVAYNVFIKAKSAEAFGGARSRAYEALVKSMDSGSGVIAAFFQSQDGRIMFKGSTI